ncbi:hypothetical protein ABT404_20970 [Streptomyces hyaluromycini]|uniref:Uncharacterized protein n=1 Tax=Streptomyces hyaluromycini TaxID=1377993 RepID=A0ABV1WYT2_9ACTN
MAHLRSRGGPALAAPVALSPTASLGLAPAAASAVPPTARATSAADGPNPASIVNTRTDHDTIESVQRAIAHNGGTIIAMYDNLDAHTLTDDSGPYDGDGDAIVDAAFVGGKHVNGFYGSGVVDALRAVK